MIYSAKLQAETLMVLPVVIKDQEEYALIDTGATNNLINELTIKKLALNMQESCRVIQGLGNSNITTSGRVLMVLKIRGLAVIDTEFDVVPKGSIGYSIILGLQFLKKNRVIVDMGKRILTRQFPDESRVMIYVARKNRIEQVRHENVPAYAVDSVILEKGKPAVSVAIGLGRDYGDVSREKEMYFEGVEKEDKAKGLDGILELGDNSVRVLMCNETTEERIKIKPGDKVGKLSTLVELIPNEEELKEWSLEELKENIELG